MKKAGKDKVDGEDEEGWDSGEGEEKSCRPCGLSSRNGGKSEQQANERKATEKTIDTGAGNKSDEKADQSENGKHAAGGKVAKRAAAERRVTEKAGKIR